MPAMYVLYVLPQFYCQFCDFLQSGFTKLGFEHGVKSKVRRRQEELFEQKVKFEGSKTEHEPCVTEHLIRTDVSHLCSVIGEQSP